MKLGISLPTTGSTASADKIGTVAETAERIGLDTVWSFERLLSPTAGAQIDGQISRITLGTELVGAVT